MNVFIILSILIIVIGVLLLVATPSVLFKLNWNEKTRKEKILMFMFYGILVYIINIIYWIIK
jgi:Ca2+/Na+ antiporter